MTPQRKMNTSKRPFVLVNMAMTADGKIATANRAVTSFGSDRDREHLYALRATADAVMCGARTVELSQATLDTGGEKFRRRRLKSGRAEHLVRVIVSGSGSIDPASEIFRAKTSPLIVLTTRRATAKKRELLRVLADEVKPFGDRELNFRAALLWLRKAWGVKRLLCEGGGALNDALFRAGLVDEIHLTLCPKIFGGRTAPTIADGLGFGSLKAAGRYRFTSVRPVRDELFIVLTRTPSGG